MNGLLRLCCGDKCDEFDWIVSHFSDIEENMQATFMDAHEDLVRGQIAILYG